MKLFPLIVLAVTGASIIGTRPSVAKPTDPAKQANPPQKPSNSVIPQPTHLSKQKLQPFLDKYCVECHGPDEQEADVRFDQAVWSITNNDTAQRWQDVLDQLNGGDMPPVDADEFPDD